jgi:hypothetical protein
MNIIDITPIHAGHPKKNHQIQPLDDQQGPGSIQFPVDEILHFDIFRSWLSHRSIPQGRPLVTPAPGMSASKAWMHM